jgi:hypothetical protein
MVNYVALGRSIGDFFSGGGLGAIKLPLTGFKPGSAILSRSITTLPVNIFM